MKAILKENGNETVLKEGTLEELKGYLKNELENLLEWANEEINTELSWWGIFFE